MVKRTNKEENRVMAFEMIKQNYLWDSVGEGACHPNLVVT